MQKIEKLRKKISSDNVIAKKVLFKNAKENYRLSLKLFATPFKSVSGTIRGTQGFRRREKGKKSRQRCFIAANLYFKTYYRAVIRGT